MKTVRLYLPMFVGLLLGSVMIFAAPRVPMAEPAELLLGIEPEHNIFDQMERYGTLSAYLSEQIGIKVNLTITSRYGEVIKRIRERQLDGAFLSAYTASMGIRQLALEPVASPVNPNGESTSRGNIFVRADSGIQTVEEMRGKSMAFVDPATMEGYLYPLAYLRSHGIHEIETYFSRYSFAGSHASVIFSVLDGRADIGAAKDTVFDRLKRQDPSIGQELRIIAQSPPEPEVTLCLTSEMAKDLRVKIREVLLNMDKTSRGKKVLREFDALHFIQVLPEDFSRIEQMEHEAGLGQATENASR